MTQTEAPVDIKATEIPKEVDGGESLVAEKLIKQVEYYFGDNNLPRDRFIKEACSKNEGWMPIETLLNFNRVKTIVIDVSEDARVAKIAEILKASELVEVDEAGTKIRRNPNVPICDTNTETRTVYLKGFHRTETVLDQLLEFFGKYDGMEAVIMRYYKEKTLETGETEKKSEDAENEEEKKDKVEPKIVWIRKFKGSIFVVFKTPEQAQKVLEEKELVFRGTTIPERMLHSEYRKKKLEEYKERMAARKKKDGKPDGDEADKAGNDGKSSEKIAEDFVKGALLKVRSIPEEFSREDFKGKWYETANEEEFKIVFVDFNKGDKEGVLRLQKEGSAAEALKLFPEGKLKVSEEKVIDFTELTEEEENKYLQQLTKKRLERKRGHPGGGRGRGGGGRGGRGFKRRRY